MRVLVVGGGGREHALAWSLARSPEVEEVLAVPGNAGIASVATCLEGDVGDIAGIAALAEKQRVDLTVIGPEAPLVAGLADELAARGLPVFGPDAAAARIEGSKSWAKEILLAAGVPTARAWTYTDAAAAVAGLDTVEPPYVVKADGLAAGKGVTVTLDRAAAIEAIEDSLVRGRFGGSGSTVVIEEYLDGEELSVFCLTDGRTVVPLAGSQDFKRAHDDDRGPNTGGMGAYSPVPHLDVVDEVVASVFEPVIATMAERGHPYRGVLFGGLMITADGPRVYEFNCRFGDPEAQVLLPRLETDLASLLRATAEGTLAGREVRFHDDACVTVVLASGGYPGSYETGIPIDGLRAAGDREGVMVFHAGTRAQGDRIVTDGGRVLAVSALGDDIAAARDRAYEAAAMIGFEGKMYRTDIAAAAAQGGRT